MTALERLTAAIEAGEFPGDLTGPEMGFPNTSAAVLYDAFSGSLDAAKALHDAVLPGWFPGLSQNIHYGRWFAWVQTKESHATAYSNNPARAWLLAIVRALIGQDARLADCAKEGKE